MIYATVSSFSVEVPLGSIGIRAKKLAISTHLDRWVRMVSTATHSFRVVKSDQIGYRKRNLYNQLQKSRKHSNIFLATRQQYGNDRNVEIFISGSVLLCLYRPRQQKEKNARKNVSFETSEREQVLSCQHPAWRRGGNNARRRTVLREAGADSAPIFLESRTRRRAFS